MGVNASRMKYMFDGDASVTLRNVSDGAESATATETAISLNELDTAYWHDGTDIPYSYLVVVINITAIDATTGDETYVLTIQVDDTLAQSDTPVTVWTQTIARTFTGVIEAVIPAHNIPKMDTDSSGTDKWMAIKATLGGTTPSLTYGAWIAKNKSF